MENREKHFVCDEPDCANCFIAFNTVQQLNDHLLQVHGIAVAARRRGQNGRENHIVARFSLNGPVRPQRRGFEGTDVQQRYSECPFLQKMLLLEEEEVLS